MGFGDVALWGVDGPVGFLLSSNDPMMARALSGYGS